MSSLPALQELKDRARPVAVVGLGYVGLPLAVALARQFSVIGFDVSGQRVEELRQGRDRTGEVEDAALSRSGVRFFSDPDLLAEAAVIIVAVPTPIDEHHVPDLRPLRAASETVGRHMAAGCVVVYESTVYPGCTREACVPLLEQHSGLACGKDFWVGYSPERINPGDRTRGLETIVKVVAGQDPAVTELLAGLYGAVVQAGVHKAPSIEVAEAAKVIENTQRDLNIALMNELALLFGRLGIDTGDVLAAAGSKWNFLPFRPGLVGGHCIGVDPYYLSHKAEAVGFHTTLITAGRQINDAMGRHVARTCVKLLVRHSENVRGARVGVLGLTFKENVPDLRNSKVADVVGELRDFGLEVLVHDPIADPEDARRELGLELTHLQDFQELDALVLAVAHDAYAGLQPGQVRKWFRRGAAPVLLDVKGFFDPATLQELDYVLWRL